MQTNVRRLPMEAHWEELISGIPNDITMDRITTKLAWKDITVLCTVNRSWRRSIRSGQVHKARARSHSTEVFFVVHDEPLPHIFAICLYPETYHLGGLSRLYPETSVGGRGLSRLYPETFRVSGFSRLPTEFELPWSNCGWVSRGIELECQIAVLDGKIYLFDSLDGNVHLLDVGAGQRQWKQCTSMLKPREKFGCGAIDGKLYVFGGGVHHESFLGSEAWNPEKDSWVAIRRIVPLFCSHRVKSSVNELFRDGRDIYYPCCDESDDDDDWEKTQLDADPLEVYDPVKDEWRVVEPVGKPKEKMFVAGGKFYSMSPLDIHVYDFHGNSWAHRHTFSFAEIAPVDSVELWPVAVVMDNCELLALVGWPNANRTYVVQSRGFGSQNKELVWQETNFALPFGSSNSRANPVQYGVRTIQL